MNIVFDCPLCTGGGGKLVSINIGTNHPLPPQLPTDNDIRSTSARTHKTALFVQGRTHVLGNPPMRSYSESCMRRLNFARNYWYVAWQILVDFAFATIVWWCAKLFYHRLVMSIVQVGLLPDGFKAGESWSEPCEGLAHDIALCIAHLQRVGRSWGEDWGGLYQPRCR